MCFIKTYFSKESTPPFVRLGLEITKELEEVIITVISSQRRQPPNGKGRRASSKKGERPRSGPPAGPDSSTDLFPVGGLPRDSVAGLPRKSVWYKFSFMSLQCLNVEGQTKKKDGKKARKRKYKRKKENKNIASFHQTFAILFSSPALKRERCLRRGLIASLSSHGRAGLPGGLQGLLWEPGLKKRPGRKLGFYPAPCPSEWWLDG